MRIGRRCTRKCHCTDLILFGQPTRWFCQIFRFKVDIWQNISYWWSFGTESLFLTVFEIYIQVYLGHDFEWPFSVTWHHQARVNLISQMSFPIGAPLYWIGTSAVFEIDPKHNYLDHDLDFSGLLDVIDHVTIRFAICHFLLVVHWNRASISNRFRDSRPNKWLRTNEPINQSTNTTDRSTSWWR